MVIAEEIQKYIQELPEPFQKEVLDFVEYLWMKSKNKQEEETWPRFSLISAMRGMEDKDSPVYTAYDLKDVF